MPIFFYCVFWRFSIRDKGNSKTRLKNHDIARARASNPFPGRITYVRTVAGGVWGGGSAAPCIGAHCRSQGLYQGAGLSAAYPTSGPRATSASVAGCTAYLQPTRHQKTGGPCCHPRLFSRSLGRFLALFLVFMLSTRNNVQNKPTSPPSRKPRLDVGLVGSITWVAIKTPHATRNFRDAIHAVVVRTVACCPHEREIASGGR
jgi:hypothetical protein